LAKSNSCPLGDFFKPCPYGLARSRYIGLEKVASEVNLKAIAYNLVRVANVALLA
jgi:IS5 family transposase